MNCTQRLPCRTRPSRGVVVPRTSHCRPKYCSGSFRAYKGEGSDRANSELDLQSNGENNKQTSTSASTSTSAAEKKQGDGGEREDLGLGLKAVWYAAEALGDVLGATKKKEKAPSSSPSVSDSGPLPRDVALRMIREDYSVDYFISGKGELAAYADDCEFRDPFAGFRGKSRFVKNVSNLGSSLEDAKTELITWDEAKATPSSPGSPSFLKTRWRFSGIVGILPWRPRLAAAGSTTHVFDDASGLVVGHVEAWESSPADVVKSLLRPANKLLPANRWEVAAACAYEGDWQGLWYASSPALAKGAGLAAAASSVAKWALSASVGGGGGGEGGPGLAELSLALLASSAAVTVVLENFGLGGGIGKRR